VSNLFIITLINNKQSLCRLVPGPKARGYTIYYQKRVGIILF